MPVGAQTSNLNSKTWQTLFQAILPAVYKHVQFAFRRLPDEQQEEAVQAALANACVACARLVAQGRTERVFASALARFAVAQVREGRMVGTPLNIRDVLSPYAQKKKHLIVERRTRFDSEEHQWLEAVRAGHRTPVPDQVCFRIDFPDWMATLSQRTRQIAQTLAAGNSTNEVARRFSISAGRVSQMRRELCDSWRRFHGECELTSATTSTS
jgi:DNA-binding NarL/FixJ family response regulator